MYRYICKLCILFNQGRITYKDNAVDNNMIGCPKQSCLFWFVVLFIFPQLISNQDRERRLTPTWLDAGAIDFLTHHAACIC